MWHVHRGVCSMQSWDIFIWQSIQFRSLKWDRFVHGPPRVWYTPSSTITRKNIDVLPHRYRLSQVQKSLWVHDSLSSAKTAADTSLSSTNQSRREELWKVVFLTKETRNCVFRGVFRGTYAPLHTCGALLPQSGKARFISSALPQMMTKKKRREKELRTAPSTDINAISARCEQLKHQ